MAISTEHEKLIIYIDQQVQKILKKDGDIKEIFISLSNIMNDLKKVIDKNTRADLDIYGKKYIGFYCFMVLLGKIASDLSKEKTSFSENKKSLYDNLKSISNNNIKKHKNLN